MNESASLGPEKTAMTGSLSPEYVSDSLEVVKNFFIAKREYLMAFFGSGDGVEIKPDGSPVTPKDSEIEQELKELLRFMNPGIGVAGEETATEGSTETYWVIDPIDSTRSYIEGDEKRPFCTNMVSLIHNGQVVLSIIYEFASDPPVMYIATEGKVAIDGQPISVDLESIKPTIWIDNKAETERNSLYELTEDDGFVASDLPPANGYRLSRFAKGELGIQVCHNPNAGQYDLVSGLYIAQQAGAIVRNIGSEDWDPSNLEVIAYWPQFEAEARKIELALAA